VRLILVRASALCVDVVLRGGAEGDAWVVGGFGGTGRLGTGGGSSIGCHLDNFVTVWRTDYRKLDLEWFLMVYNFTLLCLR